MFLSTVEAYDPTTDKWIRKANMPRPREHCAVAVVNGKIYAIGGLVAPQGARVVSTVEVYDPATDTWIAKADMPTARYRAAACVVDGRIYVSGGSPTLNDVNPALTTVEVYDPATDIWIQASGMPWGRYCHSASVLDGKMYIIGGGDNKSGRLLNEGKIELEELSELFSTVDVYDPATDTWTTAARCPFAAMEHAVGIVDGRIYTIGGWVGIEPKVRSTVEEFDPGLPDNISVTNAAGKLLTTWGKVRAASP
ncbi:Kelch repeat-containing protein [Candidatus Poribacteria bacterium]